MLKDITLGQYYPTESVSHRLDPRVKLVATLMYIVSLFLFHDFVGFIVVTLFLIAIIRMSHVPFSFMLKGVRAIWLLVVITAVCNLFFTQGAQTYFAWKFIHITDTGVSNAVYFTIRLVYLVVGTSVMTQMARGANFEEGNIIQKAKAMVPILVPLFVSAFRRANDLATAMEARCYHGGEGRTKMKPLHYISVDYKAYVVMVLYLAVVIVIRISI